MSIHFMQPSCKRRSSSSARLRDFRTNIRFRRHSRQRRNHSRRLHLHHHFLSFISFLSNLRIVATVPWGIGRKMMTGEVFKGIHFWRTDQPTAVVNMKSQETPKPCPILLNYNRFSEHVSRQFASFLMSNFPTFGVIPNEFPKTWRSKSKVSGPPTSVRIREDTQSTSVIPVNDCLKTPVIVVGSMQHFQQCFRRLQHGSSFAVSYQLRFRRWHRMERLPSCFPLDGWSRCTDDDALMAPIAFRSVADVRKCFQKSLMPGYLKIPTHTVILAAGSVKQADIRGVHQKP